MRQKAVKRLRRDDVPALWPLLTAVLSVAALHLCFMAVSGKWFWEVNPYNSYAKQAAAWARGYLDLGQDYPWLELAIFEGKYYVSFPPFPSYVLFPFALFLGDGAPDNAVALFTLLLGTGYAVKLCERMGLSKPLQAALPVFLYCSNNLWQITADGWVWFLAQNMAFTLTLMSFYYGLCGKKGRAFFFLCAAVGCRPFQILYIPVLCWLLLRENKKSWHWLLLEKDYRLLPAALLAGSFLLLNFLRFHNPFEFGHNYLPEFINAEAGQFSLAYLPGNLQSLVRLPTWENGGLQFPMFNGSSVFLCFPVIWVWLFGAGERVWRSRDRGWRELLRAALPSLAGTGLVLLHLFCLCCHKTMGGAHFGNRYVSDVMPAVFLLCLDDRRDCPASPTALKICKTAGFCLLALGGLILNFWGVLQFYRGAA